MLMDVGWECWEFDYIFDCFLELLFCEGEGIMGKECPPVLFDVGGVFGCNDVQDVCELRVIVRE